MVRIFATVIAGLLGLAFGSFLNVCLSRWPEGESVVMPRSHCRHCVHTLAWWENLPLVSWLAMRGRCRRCRTFIGWRYPLVETAIGALWATVSWRAFKELSNINFEFAAGMMFFYFVLVALAALDAEHLWLPNIVTLPSAVIGIALFLLISYQNNITFDDTPTPLRDAGIRLLGALAAAALILFIRWTYWLIRRREGIGMGDAKLMALLAAWLGLPGALLAFAIGVVMGALVALAILIIPRNRTTTHPWATMKLPLGTFLCLGGIVSSLWGSNLIAAYIWYAGFN
jgi:leader peptidase (prepilin peptidase) / N-methyltransferase